VVPAVERIRREAASRTEEGLADRSEAAADNHEFRVEDGDQVGDTTAEFGADFCDETAGDFVAGIGRCSHVLAPDRAGLESVGE
jgi:hypothetical protein